MNPISQALADYRQGKRTREEAEAWRARPFAYQTSGRYRWDRYQRVIERIAERTERAWLASAPGARTPMT